MTLEEKQNVIIFCCGWLDNCQSGMIHYVYGERPRLLEGKPMSVITAEYAHLSTTCECEDEEGNWAEDCYGCYQDNLAYLKDEFLPDWYCRNQGDFDYVLIEGKAMGWTRAEGFLLVEFDSLVDSLKINGEYTLRFKLEGKELSAVRTSHDEPTGAFFTFSLLDDVEVQD